MFNIALQLRSQTLFLSSFTHLVTVTLVLIVLGLFVADEIPLNMCCYYYCGDVCMCDVMMLCVYVCMHMCAYVKCMCVYVCDVICMCAWVVCVGDLCVCVLCHDDDDVCRHACTCKHM